MDAFELNEFIQAQIKTGQEFKVPVIREIKPVSVSPDLIPDNLTTKVNQNQSSFPWAEVVILGGVTVLIIIIIIKIRESQNYNSFTRKRKNQQSIYQ
jgi:hypothetical protein